MTYTVKEIFYTLQGEGFHTGRPAVFCRFSGCNLWTGREEDRHKATCKFCDTDFVGTGPDGGKFESADDLANAVAKLWPAHNGYLEGKPYVICTGGEPLLQLDEQLVRAFRRRSFEVGIETNGTQPIVPGINWVCVSPKADAELVLHEGDELKLVYPQPGAIPEQFEPLSFAHFYLQPMDGPDLEKNTQAALQYCLAHPRWRLSIQTHKLLGIR